jgi:uncharacterized protein YabN with tetrapyrrole methylase and pyrophosphatase domain
MTTSTSNQSQAPDITIVGLGIVAIRQITREVESALRTARKIFFLDHGFGVKEHLESLCPEVVDLYPISYRDNESRVGAYDRMSAAVLAGALEDSPVVFAVYGHPKIYVYPTFQVTEAAKILGLRVAVLPGISSLDTILIDLGLDPGIDGLQMYEATDLLLRERPLQPDVPCLLWQIGPIESSLYSRKKSASDRFHRLQSHLLKFYPSAHHVKAICSSGHCSVASSVDDFVIAEITKRLPEVSPVATLYIPPTTRRAVADSLMLGNLTSTEHLRRITVDS